MSITMSAPTREEAGPSSSLQSQQLCRHFTISDINSATQNFDESLVIGRGGFGKVYKGIFVYGGSHVVGAVKRLDSTSNQGATEFWSEIEMLSKLRHSHLVSLLGYCNEGKEMILVYEYMPYGTLADHLHKLHFLSWVRRLKICIGAARGLDYLHTGTGTTHGVIHRDIKTSNILLGKTLAAKISDFGLSKIGPTNQPSTHVSTYVKGTFGYLDPDYFATGRLTRKSDVYAFGVVLFEVLCGKRAVDSSLGEEQCGLARWAQDSIKEGKVNQIIDPNLRGKISPKCLKEFARLAERCLHSDPKKRPTMSEVVFSLESILSLQEKSNKSVAPAVTKIFGRKVPVSLFPSNGENCGGGRGLKSLDFDFYANGGESIELLQFKFDVIRTATDNFAESNKTSGDGMNSTYKGRLQNGQGITVKKFYSDSPHQLECRNQASLLVKLEHENLVQPLGYWLEGATILLLVYDFALYASLDCLISDPVMHAHLHWNKCYNIILGVGKGLLYLHKHTPMPILNCDISPGNILLDESLEPKISYIWLARSLARKYMAPEYRMNGQVSAMIDVFNFGVLALETIQGLTYSRFFSETQDFLRHAWTNWWEERTSNRVDLTIDTNPGSISRYILVALLCTQNDACERPTMDEVVEMLTCSSYLTLRIPKRPEYSVGFSGKLKSFDQQRRKDNDGSLSSSYPVDDDVDHRRTGSNKRYDRVNSATAGTNETLHVSTFRGKAGLGVLDTLLSSMLKLNLHSGSARKVSILAFEVSNTIVKGSNLMLSLSEENILIFKRDVLHSEEVQLLVSTDMNELLSIAAADKREEYGVFSRDVVRFGNMCVDPQWHNLDCFFSSLDLGPLRNKQLREKTESALQELNNLVHHTSELYRELLALDRYEQDYRRRLEEGESLHLPGKGESVMSLQIKLKHQKKLVRNLKKKSLWSRSLEEVVGKLVGIVTFIHLAIVEAFGENGAGNVLQSSMASSTKSSKEARIKSKTERLGVAGLTFHYAKLITQIEAIVSHWTSFTPTMKVTLYNSLPHSIKRALPSRLRLIYGMKVMAISQIKAELEKILHWLVPVATNTTKAHQGFGLVGDSDEIGMKTAGNYISRLQTLHHADLEKTDQYILDLIIWLHLLIISARDRDIYKYIPFQYSLTDKSFSPSDPPPLRTTRKLQTVQISTQESVRRGNEAAKAGSWNK